MSQDVRNFLSLLRGGRLVVAIIIGVGLLLAVGRAFAGAYVEILWQMQAGYATVFWKRVIWEWGSRITVGVIVASLVLVNLKIASATLGGIQIRRRVGNIEISEQIPKEVVWWGMLIASVLMGTWFGAAVPPSVGIQSLLLFTAESWGLVDPVLNRDIGWYVFWLPVLRSAVTLAIILIFLVFTLVAAGYAATGAIRWTGNRVNIQERPRLHLGSLLAAFLLLLAVQLTLQRYGLLLDGNSPVQGIFGFSDAEARLPAYQTISVICVFAAMGAGWGAWKGQSGPLLASLVGVAFGTILLGQFWPSLFQRYWVEPNELESETPYIEHNLEFTRIGFGLDGLERRAFAFEAEEGVDWTLAGRQFAGLPVWNQSALLATYRELEALFPYYDFGSVTIDRYESPEGPVPVALSVREVDPGGIQDPNWQNQHLRKRYVAGVGTVASLASIRTPEGRPEMLITGIPPEVAGGAREIPELGLERPDIFYGIRQQRYAVVNPEAEEYFTLGMEPALPGVDFPIGIELTSLLRTGLLAWRFRDPNLIFASELTETSRFIYRRSVTERAQALAPFLRFPEEAYPVVAGGRVVWVLEGFTTTWSFPLSTATDFGSVRSGARYVRNSVKVTIDAVTGQVTFYRVPIDDPLADAYENAFPGLFQPIDAMPMELRQHLRYPRSLLSLQSRVLLQYHQETAATFHGQQDVWDEPQELAENTSPVPYRPEYGLYTIPGETDPSFHLTTLFVPAGRQNLTGVLVGRTNDAGVPESILFDVPVADQVPGPRQVEALVEQDPQISQQFSLWRTGGSQVWTGHLHLVPVGGRMVYMEPVFLAAEADAIPELRRFVVSDGRRVAMTETLADAISELETIERVGTLVDVPEDPGMLPTPGNIDLVSVSEWPSEALQLLEEAESSAREGNWQGFGAALVELRLLLEGLDN